MMDSIKLIQLCLLLISSAAIHNSRSPNVLSKLAEKSQNTAPEFISILDLSRF